MVELKGFKDLQKHLQLNVFSSPGGCAPKITLRFFLQKAICQKWDVWRQAQTASDCSQCQMIKKNTDWTLGFVCTHLSLSTLLKPGRMCLKLELRSSLGWLLVRLMEPFSRRLRNPWPEDEDKFVSLSQEWETALSIILQWCETKTFVLLQIKNIARVVFSIFMLQCESESEVKMIKK